MAYDRQDGREQRRIELASRLAAARRRLREPATRAGRRGAVPHALATVVLLGASPWITGNPRLLALVHLPVTLVSEAIAHPITSSDLERRWRNHPPRAEGRATLVATGRIPVHLGAHDEDETDDVVVLVLARPEHGALVHADGSPLGVIEEPGDYVYEPQPGFEGIDRFAFAAFDRIDRSAALEQSVQVYDLTPAPPRPPDPTRRRDADRRRSTRETSRERVQVTAESIERGSRELEQAAERTEPRWRPGGDSLAGPIVPTADLE